MRVVTRTSCSAYISFTSLAASSSPCFNVDAAPRPSRAPPGARPNRVQSGFCGPERRPDDRDDDACSRVFSSPSTYSAMLPPTGGGGVGVGALDSRSSATLTTDHHRAARLPFALGNGTPNTTAQAYSDRGALHRQSVGRRVDDGVPQQQQQQQQQHSRRSQARRRGSAERNSTSMSQLNHSQALLRRTQIHRCVNRHLHKHFYVA